MAMVQPVEDYPGDVGDDFDDTDCIPWLSWGLSIKGAALACFGVWSVASWDALIGWHAVFFGLVLLGHSALVWRRP